MIHNPTSVLALFSHPDDETLAAGATIKKLSSTGANVHVAIANTGIHSRRNIQDEATRAALLGELQRDCQQALDILGIRDTNVHLGEFADNEIDRHTRLELIHWVEELIERTKPELILTHHRFCTNIDHQYCHEAAVIATRPSVNCHIPILCGEIPSSTGYLRPAQWEPNFYVQISEEELNCKITAMQTYKGEARPDPHPRSPEVLRALAKVRGSESGYFFAEAFMVQRSFWA